MFHMMLLKTNFIGCCLLQRLLPRFTEENLEHNKVFYSRVENLARKYGCSPAQLALTWVLNQGDDVVPIPGGFACLLYSCSQISYMNCICLD